MGSYSGRRGGPDVGGDCPKPALVRQEKSHSPRPSVADRQDEHEEPNERVVPRQNAQRSTYIKRLEVMTVILGIDQDASDQKSDSTKNRSTPIQPQLVIAVNGARSSGVSVSFQLRWMNSTARMATPRTPSSAGRCRSDCGVDFVRAESIAVTRCPPSPRSVADVAAALAHVSPICGPTPMRAARINELVGCARGKAETTTNQLPARQPKPAKGSLDRTSC